MADDPIIEPPAESAAAAAAAAPAAPVLHQTGAWPMWLLGLVIMIDQVDQNLVRGMITPLKQDPDLNMTDGKIAILLSCFIIVNAVIAVPAGYLADRWVRTRTIGHTIVGWSLVTALGGAFASYPWLIGVRASLGFGQAVTEPSCASLLGDYYASEKRGKAFSVQQVLLLAGAGVGVGLGGVLGATIGWRAAFLVVGLPGVLLSVLVYRLREPGRGEADRIHMGIAEPAVPEEQPPLLEDGLGTFLKDLMVGLRADAKTILQIRTMRFALVGVTSLLFTITAVGAALPQFYERSFGVGLEPCPAVAPAAPREAWGKTQGVVASFDQLDKECRDATEKLADEGSTKVPTKSKGTAELLFTLLILIGGLPGVILGGVVADKFQDKIRGARMAIPAYCIGGGNALFFISYLRVPLLPAFLLQCVGFFIVAMAIPGLRAGLTDAVPHNLRGAGFGLFNLVSALFGAAGAPLIVFSLAGAFDGNLRTAFLIVTPPVFLGAYLLLKARDSMDEDAGKIFMAIATAMQEQQAVEAARAAEHAAAAAAGAPATSAGEDEAGKTSAGEP